MLARVAANSVQTLRTRTFEVLSASQSPIIQHRALHFPHMPDVLHSNPTAAFGWNMPHRKIFVTARREPPSTVDVFPWVWKRVWGRFLFQVAKYHQRLIIGVSRCRASLTIKPSCSNCLWRLCTLVQLAKKLVNVLADLVLLSCVTSTPEVECPWFHPGIPLVTQPVGWRQNFEPLFGFPRALGHYRALRQGTETITNYLDMVYSSSPDHLDILEQLFMDLMI